MRYPERVEAAVEAARTELTQETLAALEAECKAAGKGFAFVLDREFGLSITKAQALVQPKVAPLRQTRKTKVDRPQRNRAKLLNFSLDEIREKVKNHAGYVLGAPELQALWDEYYGIKDRNGNGQLCAIAVCMGLAHGARRRTLDEDDVRLVYDAVGYSGAFENGWLHGNNAPREWGYEIIDADFCLHHPLVDHLPA